MQQTTTISGHTIIYDIALVDDGIHYLMRIGPQESKAFFDEAHGHGFAIFEDHNGYKYKLIYDNEKYELVKP